MDAGTDPLRVRLFSTHGTITLAGFPLPSGGESQGEGLTFLIGTGTNDRDMTFTGTIPDLNAALDGLTFTPDPNFHGPADLMIEVNDLEHTGTGGPQTAGGVIDIGVSPVNDAPIISYNDLVLSSTFVLEYEPFTLSGTFIDVDVGQTHKITISWGDQSASVIDIGPDIFEFGPISHVFNQHGIYAINVQVEDDQGATATASIEATVLKEVNLLTIFYPQDGGAVPDDKELSVGSFTVTNINDTDGNGKPDVEDQKVLVAQATMITQASNLKRKARLIIDNAAGFAADLGLDKDEKGNYLPTINGAPNRIRVRDKLGSELVYMESIDVKKGWIELTTQLSRAYEKEATKVEVGEVDLMKLVVHAPAGTGALALEVEKGPARLWKDPNKVEAVANKIEIPLENTSRDHVFWVEVTETDYTKLTLRGILIAASLGETGDKVSATGVWATRTNFWTEAKPGANPGDPKALHGDVDSRAMMQTFKDFYDGELGMGVFHGLGIKDDKGNSLPFTIGGRVQQEFTLWPMGIGKEKDIVVDVSRQVAAREFIIYNGPVPDALVKLATSVSGNQVLIGNADFPTKGWNRSEVATDDPDNDIDEDNSPTNDHVYVIDGPGVVLIDPDFGHIAAFANFNEFVRFKFGQTSFVHENFSVQGSRGSPLEPWHYSLYAKRGSGLLDPDDYAKTANDAFVFDSEPASASFPQLTQGDGNGTIKVTVDKDKAKTEAWIVVYVKRTDTWSLYTYGPKNDKPTKVGVSDVPDQNGIWLVKADDGRISVEITQGNQKFKNASGFRFSTFKTSAEKKNEISIGHIRVDAGP